MKKLLLAITIIASIAYAGTVIEVPTHEQNITLWRVLITLPAKNLFDVVAYFTSETGKLPPQSIGKDIIGYDGNILAFYIKRIASRKMTT